MRIAFDPTPLHSTHSFVEFPRVTAALGYEWIQLSPHVDFLPFFRHPRVDGELVQANIDPANTIPCLCLDQVDRIRPRVEQRAPNCPQPRVGLR